MIINSGPSEQVFLSFALEGYKWWSNSLVQLILAEKLLSHRKIFYSREKLIQYFKLDPHLWFHFPTHSYVFLLEIPVFDTSLVPPGKIPESYTSVSEYIQIKISENFISYWIKHRMYGISIPECFVCCKNPTRKTFCNSPKLCNNATSRDHQVFDQP